MSGYYSIWGCYKGQWEKIDQASSDNEAWYLAREYKLSFGREWTIEIRHKGQHIQC